MTVKATGYLTLSTYRDIESVTRYYTLQAPDTTPSKPETNPPPDEWTDTAPSYIRGSTDSLYFCDLTIFSNGEWEYSAVSKSGSYEAANDAYNKATDTANDVGELKNQVLGSYKILLDENGEPVPETDEEGNILYDDNGNVIYKQVYNDGMTDSIQYLNDQQAATSDAIAEVEKEQTKLKESVAVLEATSEVVSVRFEDLNGKVASWFDFEEEGALVIGKEGSPVVSRQTNESYSFVEKNSGEELLRLDTGGATVDTLNADQIRFGRDNPQWAIRQGAYISGVGYNLNDVWIGG